MKATAESWRKQWLNEILKKWQKIQRSNELSQQCQWRKSGVENYLACEKLFLQASLSHVVAQKGGGHFFSLPLC